jgi:hypothetical protein
MDGFLGEGDARLFLDTLPCAHRDVFPRVRNRDLTGLGLVLEVVVRARNVRKLPAVRLQGLDDFPRGHSRSVHGLGCIRYRRGMAAKRAKVAGKRAEHVQLAADLLKQVGFTAGVDGDRLREYYESSAILNGLSAATHPAEREAMKLLKRMAKLVEQGRALFRKSIAEHSSEIARDLFRSMCPALCQLDSLSVRPMKALKRERLDDDSVARDASKLLSFCNLLVVYGAQEPSYRTMALLSIVLRLNEPLVF